MKAALLLCTLGAAAALSIRGDGPGASIAMGSKKSGGSGYHHGCYHQDSTAILSYERKMRGEYQRLYTKAMNEQEEQRKKQAEEQEKQRKEWEAAYQKWLNGSSNGEESGVDLHTAFQPAVVPSMDLASMQAQDLMRAASQARNASDLDRNYNGCPECRPSRILDPQTFQIKIDEFGDCLRNHLGLFAEDTICHMKSVDYLYTTCGNACTKDWNSTECTRCGFNRLKHDYECFGAARGVSHHCSACHADVEIFNQEKVQPKCATMYGYNPWTAGQDCVDALEEHRVMRKGCEPNRWVSQAEFDKAQKAVKKKDEETAKSDAEIAQKALEAADAAAHATGLLPDNVTLLNNSNSAI